MLVGEVCSEIDKEQRGIKGAQGRKGRDEVRNKVNEEEIKLYYIVNQIAGEFVML